MHFTSICFAVFLFVQLNEHVWCQTMPPQGFQSHLMRRNITGSSQHYRTSRPVSNFDETSKAHSELLTNLHDRVSVLASLNEDLRKRLQNIENKIDHFESSSLGRIDSIAVQQTDILKRLDTLDYIERQTKRNTNELKNDLNHVKEREENIFRTARGIDRLPRMPTNDTQLESLEALCLGTRSALDQFEKSFSKFSDTVTRRLNNIQRQNNRQKPNFYSTDQPSEPLITSCAHGHPTANGILRLQLTPQSQPFYVRCEEQNIFGGGWTIVQNRFNGKLNFYRDWLEYQAGFGNLAGEFFIGLDKLHALTTSAVHELLILMQDFDGTSRYARYNLFAIGSEKEEYALNLLGEYEGDAGDSLTYHAGSKFSTFDKDNDGSVDYNCAQLRSGAWWYNWCEMSNLNGKYYDANDKAPLYEGVYWNEFRGPSYSLKAVKMLIRPVEEGDLQRR